MTARKMTSLESQTLALYASPAQVMRRQVKPDWRDGLRARIIEGVLSRGADPDIAEADAAAIAEYGRSIGGPDGSRG